VSLSKTLEGGGPEGSGQPPAEPPRPETDPVPTRPPAAEPPAGRESATLPRDLGPLLDDALGRMERRAQGVERPVPLPWTNVSAALGGGLWSGTLVTLVGDTGSGKTQWALQAALHAAESGAPVCYVAPDSGVDQIAARLLALKAGQRWSDLYVGRTGPETLERLRLEHAGQLRGLPFHVVGARAVKDEPPDIRGITRWMRERYPEERLGTRPVLVVLDFVLLVSGVGQDREQIRDMMRRAASEGRQAARDLGAVVLLVSTTSREMRSDSDESIGIHRDRRQPAGLGRGNPARLVLTGKDAGDVERESDTILVLAQEPWKGKRPPGKWTKVWCAVARNRAGARAWCALRFDGTRFDEDPDLSLQATPPEPAEEDREEPPNLREEE
jgi:replicative DNA helicase